MDEYGKRLVEVYEVLRYMPKDEVEKIPEDLKEAIKDGRDSDYEWHYDIEKKLVEQDLHTDTIAILSYLNMEYILTPEQRKVIEQSHLLNDRIKDYKENKSIDEKSEIKTNNVKIECNELVVEEEKKSIFSTILDYIKHIFNK